MMMMEWGMMLCWLTQIGSHFPCCYVYRSKWGGDQQVTWLVLNIDVQVKSFLTHMLGIAKSTSEWISCCSTIIFLGGNVSLQLSKWCLNETPYHPQTSWGHLMITEQLLLHINLIGIQYSPWGELKLWAENNMIAFWTDYHMQRSWDIIGCGLGWMGLCWKQTWCVSHTFSATHLKWKAGWKKWQPCVDWSFSLAQEERHDPPFIPHAALQLCLDWIWLKIKWCTKSCWISGGNCVHKGEKQPFCNRATIRAKVTAHQPSGFSACSASNYLGDLIFRNPTAIWLPVNPLCRSFLIFNLPTIMLQCIIYFVVAS